MDCSIAFHEAVDRLIEYLDSTDEWNGGPGHIDTGEVLWLVGKIKEIRDREKGY